MSQDLGTYSLIWIVGDVGSLNFGTAQLVTNKALKTGPFDVYTPPNRYSILRIKASLKSVQEELESSSFNFHLTAGNRMEGNKKCLISIPPQRTCLLRRASRILTSSSRKGAGMREYLRSSARLCFCRKSTNTGPRRVVVRRSIAVLDRRVMPTADPWVTKPSLHGYTGIPTLKGIFNANIAPNRGKRRSIYKLLTNHYSNVLTGLSP
jgi:hypothetical protein